MHVILGLAALVAVAYGARAAQTFVRAVLASVATVALLCAILIVIVELRQ